MRNHVQGVGLLLVLAGAVCGIAWLAAPAVGDAFGEDGAVRAESLDDVIDLSSESTVDELTEEEIFNIQYLLTIEGYDTRGVDGQLGPATRTAIDQAKLDYGLGSQAADRAVLDYFFDRRDDNEPADEADAVTTDAEGGSADLG